MTTKRTDGLEPEVLLLSNERDLSLDWIVRELRRRGVPYVRLNTERCTRLSWDVDPRTATWRLADEGQRTNLSGVRSVLYRRPEPPTMPGLSGSDRRLALAQWSALIAGLSSLDARWMNQPHLVARAESKILQLRIATRLGLSVPLTRVTNAGETARAFARRVGPRVVVKALDAPLVGPKSNEGFVFSTLVPTGDLAEVADHEKAPFIIQRPISPKVDLRVTVIGSRALAAAATADTFDWRRQDPPPSFAPIELDNTSMGQAVALVRELGLLYGALDFAIDKRGRPHFLELNPNGEWGWLQRSGMPIAEAIVDELTSHRTARS